MKTKYYNIQNTSSNNDSFSATSRVILTLLNNNGQIIKRIKM